MHGSKGNWFRFQKLCRSILIAPSIGWYVAIALQTRLVCPSHVCFACRRGRTDEVIAVLQSDGPSLPDYARKAVIELAQSKPDFYPMPSWTHLSQLHGPRVPALLPLLIQSFTHSFTQSFTSLAHSIPYSLGCGASCDSSRHPGIKAQAYSLTHSLSHPPPPPPPPTQSPSHCIPCRCL